MPRWLVENDQTSHKKKVVTIMMALSDQEMAMEQFGSGSHITLFPVDMTNTDTKALSGAFFFLLFGRRGVEVALCCGSCGVLAEIPAGDVIIPVRALRDEGASYKYLPPSRYVELDKRPVEVFRQVLTEKGIPYVECTTWSTDGFYRETKDMVEHRISQGCQAVEMECSTMAAVARFRGKLFGQLLYSGDILVGNEEYDDRNWFGNLSARERIFWITLEALVRI